MMIRYFARRAGTSDLFEVVDSYTWDVIGEPKLYHDANDEAGAGNEGTFGLEIAEAA